MTIALIATNRDLGGVSLKITRRYEETPLKVYKR
jgi:hypothetical protein